MASLMLWNAWLFVCPWLTQPGIAGHSTTHTSSSSRWAATRNFPILPKLKTVMRLAAPVHVTAMAYFDDNDERFDIPDFIDNPIDALPDSIALLTGQLFYAGWDEAPRLAREYVTEFSQCPGWEYGEGPS